MLDYNMAERGELKLYEHLYRSIRDDIVSGVLEADDRLPSKRALAAHLGVSVITVESAYMQLAAEGFISSRPRSGYYVARLPGEPRAGNGLMGLGAASGRAPAQAPTRDEGWDATPSLENRTSGRAAGTDPRPDDSATASQHTATLLVDLAHPNPSLEAASRLWGRALRSTLAQESDDELFGPLLPRGSLRLRQAITSHLRGTRGIVADPADVVVGAGAQVLYNYLVQLLGSGQVVAVEDPGYLRLTRVYQSAGATVAHLGLDSEGLSMGELRASGASVAHLMPSHQYPTGRVTSIARRYELLSWASEAPGRYLIEDDYDCEFRLAGRPIPALASIDATGSVIYLSTFSRGISSALRIAYMVLPSQLSRSFNARLGFYSSTVSAVGQVTLARLLESGEYERHVARARTQARRERDLLLDALMSSKVADRLQVEEADSGLHFVLAVETNHSEGEIADRALEQDLALEPLSHHAALPEHAINPDGRARFVVRYDGLDSNHAQLAAHILEQIL